MTNRRPGAAWPRTLLALLLVLAGCSGATMGLGGAGDDASAPFEDGATGSDAAGSVGPADATSASPGRDGGPADGGVEPTDGTVTTGGRDAGHDSGTIRDAGAAPTDGGAAAMTGVDANLCDDMDVWLAPMNAARAATDAGEPPLVCDPIAAQVALDYASQCNYAHNANRSSDYAALGGKDQVGENIAAGAPTESIAAAVASWNDELQSYDITTNTCAAGAQCGHYTQIVWKTTTAVGCAHVSCTTNSPFGTTGGGKWDFSVCDYTPAGNIENSQGVVQRPY